MWFGDEADAVRLEALAHEQLERGDVAAALETAARLVEMRWSGGFVVEAMSHRRAGRVEDAVRGLEKAVERAGRDWRLWQLLGNLRSDLERFDEAVTAFDRALECEGAAKVVVRFNRAIAHRRAERFGEALMDLDPILALPKPPPEIAEAALALALECLAGIGRAGDAREMIEAALETCAESDPRRPRLDAEYALALERAGADREDVEAAFARATDAGVATPALLVLGRKLYPPPVGDAPSRLQLVVQGEAPPGSDAGGFLRVFDVVASTPEDALAEARRYVPSHARAGLTIERCDVREAPTQLPPGVHAASDIMLFA